MKNNRKCVLCSTEYSYCGSGCRGDVGKPTWMKLYCCENCKDVFTTLNDYNFGKIDKSQAQERLSSCDLSIELNDHYRNEINDIIAFEESPTEEVIKPKRNVRYKAKIVEDAIPEEIKEEILGEVVE